MLLVLGVTEPPWQRTKEKKRTGGLEEALSTTLVRDAATRLVFLNEVVSEPGLVMFWMNQNTGR